MHVVVVVFASMAVFLFFFWNYGFVVVSTFKERWLHLTPVLGVSFEIKRQRPHQPTHRHTLTHTHLWSFNAAVSCLECVCVNVCVWVCFVVALLAITAIKTGVKLPFNILWPVMGRLEFNWKKKSEKINSWII